jgi:hypothetical protein
MTFMTFFALALLLVVIPFTRLFGVVGLMLLLYFQPYSTTGVLLLMGIAYYFIYWRKSHV